MAKSCKIFVAKYKAPGLRIKRDSLPRLKHTPRQFLLEDVFILEAGTELRGGQEREYQILKCYLKESVITG